MTPHRCRGNRPRPRPPPPTRGTSVRLLREMAEGLEALAAEVPVVLLLEDVHWADYSTIDLLSALARRRSPCACWWSSRTARPRFIPRTTRCAASYRGC